MTTVELLELALAQAQAQAQAQARAAALPTVSVQSLNKIYTACTLRSEVEWL
jgi:hypothetical protein